MRSIGINRSRIPEIFRKQNLKNLVTNKNTCKGKRKRKLKLIKSNVSSLRDQMKGNAVGA